MTPTEADSYFVDTAVIAYALGGEHDMRRPCQRILRGAGDGALELHASVEMIQELLFHRMRKVDRTAALAQARGAAEICDLHPFDTAVLHRSFDVVALYPPIRGRDAVHAATALEVGITTMISPDRAFDAVAGLTRRDPHDIAATMAASTA